MGSTVKDPKGKGKTYAKDLRTHMISYGNKIDSVNSALKAIMKGNGSDAYWQGETAYDWYDKARLYLNKIIGNYKNSYNEFEDYTDLFARALAKSSKGGKKLSKSVLKLIDGDEYRKGVKKNKENKKITSIPATVKKNMANDDQTTSAMTAYKNMKNALNDLLTVTGKLSTDWTNIAKITTGKMKTDAGHRQKYMGNRKKEIKQTLDDLETDWLGDMLFDRKAK